MLLLKNLELISSDVKSPLSKQTKNTYLSFETVSENLESFNKLLEKLVDNTKDIEAVNNSLIKLVENSEKSNQLLEEIRDLLLTTNFQSTGNKQSQPSRKMFIPNPDISDVKGSKKQVKSTMSETSDLEDTLKSLSEINTVKE